jgi:hypothetical protein
VEESLAQPHLFDANCFQTFQKKRSREASPANLVVQISLVFLDAHFRQLLCELGIGDAIALS